MITDQNLPTVLVDSFIKSYSGNLLLSNSYTVVLPTDDAPTNAILFITNFLRSLPKDLLIYYVRYEIILLFPTLL